MGTERGKHHSNQWEGKESRAKDWEKRPAGEDELLGKDRGPESKKDNSNTVQKRKNIECQRSMP